MHSHSHFDFYVFTDGNGNYLARNNKTGNIESTSSNADVPLQYAIDQLSMDSTIGTTAVPIPGVGDNYHLWTGGKYGAISVGPGTYYFHNGVILKSYITIQGAGPWSTVFTWPDNLLLGNRNQTVFRSSLWDSNSTGGGILSSEALQRHDLGVALKGFQIYGNWRSNIIPAINTATTALDANGIETAGFDSWGHGIAWYGYGLCCDNLQIHGCPGAGIIIQNIGTTLGSGWTYPIFGGIGSGMHPGLCYITNCNCWANGRQGILIRGNTYVSNYWSYANGEAGIDCQTSQYFSGDLNWVRGIECFLDGVNHGSPSTTTYDPLGFECRLSGYLSDSYIEAPYGCSDNLMIGGNGTYGGTGYQIHGNGGITASNIFLDYVRSSGIFIGPAAQINMIRNARVKAVYAGSPYVYNNITPLTVLNGGNSIELTWSGFNDGANFTTNGVVLGAAAGPPIWGNELRLFSKENGIGIDPEYELDQYKIDMIFSDTISALGTKYVVKPGKSINPIYQHLDVDIIGYLRTNCSHNGGTTTLSANGSTTTFTVAHLLFTTPTVVETRASNSAAASAPSYYMTADGTNITFNFTSAPAAGTLMYWWTARVNP